MLAQLPPRVAEHLVVDETTGDDAAVLRIEGDRALVQTVDFFTPIVDDPRVFGAIAATNAVSDIYAMGAEPILGLAIAGFPTDKLPLTVLEEILRGGAEKAAEAGFPIAGGHTIIDDVPKYGLAVTGTAPLDRIVRNSTGNAGDRLYLTKPLGTGILVTAYRGTANARVRRALSKETPVLDEAIAWMTTLNRDAARAMVAAGASAATDVTGYGLLGHLLEVCRASGVGATLRADSLPVVDGALEWLERGFFSAGSETNLATFSPHVRGEVAESLMRVLADAQTSGGLLIAVAPDREAALRSELQSRGVTAWAVGELTADAGVIEVT